MALDVSKLRQQEQVQAAGNKPVASTSASSSSQPIDMKTGTMTAEEKQAKVLEFMNSSIYKECKDEEKLELLKAEFPFLAEMPKEELQKLITEIQAKIDNKTTETQNKIDTEVDAKTPADEVAEETTSESDTSELEQLAKKYCEDNNLTDISIDDLYCEILKKDKNDLTADELKIVNLLNNTRNSDTEKILADVELSNLSKYYNTNEQGIKVPKDDYYLLDTAKQIEVATQLYLEETIPNFAELSEEEKLNLLRTNHNDIISILDSNPNWKNCDNENILLKKALGIIIVAKTQGLSVQELKEKDNETIEELIFNTGEQVKKDFEKNIEQSLSNELGEDIDFQISEKDIQLYEAKITLKKILLNSDPQFIELSKEKQDEIIKSKIKDYVEKELSQLPVRKSKENLPQDEIDARQTKRENKAIENVRTLLIAIESEKDIKNKAQYIDTLYDLSDNQTKLIRTELRAKQIEAELQADKTILAKNSERLEQKHRDLRNTRFNEYILKNYGDPEKMSSEDRRTTYQKIINDPNTPQDIKQTAQKRLNMLEKNQDLDSHSHVNETELTNNAYEFLDKYNIYNDTKAAEILTHTEKMHCKIEKTDFYMQLMLASSTMDNPKTFMEQIEAAMLKDGFTPEEIKKIKQNHENIIFAAISSETGEDMVEFREIYGDTPITQEMAQYVAKWLKDPNEQAIAAKGYLDKYSKEIATGMNLYNTIDQTTEVFDLLGKDKDVNAGDLSIFAENIIETSTSDNNRLALADRLSDMGNPAILEGIAAGADSIQNQSYRTQYNSIVNQAAQNYPPEVQQTIRTALTTGQVSQETRNNTESASNTYYSGTNNSGVTNKNTYNTHQQAPTYTSSNNQNNLGVTKTTLENNVNPTVQKSNTDAAKIKEQAINNEAQANQKMKDIALENVAEVKQKIDESIAEWELKQELKLSDEVISELKEIAASEALEEYIQANPTKKEQIIQKLSNATSLSEVYDILLSNLGSKVHQKFIDNLARSGSTSEVRAFIKSKAGNTAVIKEILLRTSNQTLRSELINMLPASDVIELLEKNLITALNSIDHKIIYEYLAKNIYSMTQTNFANYLKYLPLDEREKLIALRNKAYGVNPTQTQQAEVQVQTTQGAQQNGQNVAQTQPAQPKVATNPQTQQHTPNTKKADEPQTENPQTKFKAGETTKILNDGRVITSLGTSFAGISDNTEEGFRIVDPKANKKAKEGAPIGMNDEVLVPGSQEWLMKYNKQAPKTAFTMAALEEQAEDTGLNLGSNHAKIGQPIKKKYNPNNFNIRG